ncbi:MAG: hypothetical protein GY940_47455 [bacterium]|nr:hypothetical protein [bacterium]
MQAKIMALQGKNVDRPAKIDTVQDKIMTVQGKNMARQGKNKGRQLKKMALQGPYMTVRQKKSLCKSN